jgi:hypothetical protein
MGTSDSHPDIALLLPTWSCPKSKAPNSPKGFRCRPDIKVLFMTGYTRNAVVHNGVRDESVRMIGKGFRSKSSGSARHVYSQHTVYP